MYVARDMRDTGQPTDVLIGGFCGSAAGYAELRRTMYAETGNETVFVDSRRWGLPFPSGGEDYPRALYRQAKHTAQVLRGLDLWRVRLYGHSMGAAVALIFADAFRHAFQIDHVVAMNPACLYLDGVVPLALRMHKKARLDRAYARHHDDPQVQRIVRARRAGDIRYLSNPVRSVAEGLALARTPLLSQLLPRLSGGKTRISVAYSTQDIVFLANKMGEALNTFPGIDAFQLQDTEHDVQYTPTSTVRALVAHNAL
jgi:pimeloyl-ACP methyl ester carboxylesterase